MKRISLFIITTVLLRPAVDGAAGADFHRLRHHTVL